MEGLVNPSFWKNKRVFLTGHTGFKGSWMSLWLLKAGANLTGYSLGFPTDPSLFQDLNIARDMNSVFGDIRNEENLKKAVAEAKPEIVIHMAAQPLVRYSYQAPVETYMTNVMGTVHLFEAVRAAGTVKSVLNVTSDKCYENRERKEGYREDEAMGGYDPYSNSKGCAELVTSAYRTSFFQRVGIGIASGRAGNVIGGGDWAQDRLLPDIVRAINSESTLVIRSPRAVRPWQHVLEPVGGYLHLIQKLHDDRLSCSEGFNFGPADSDHCNVEDVLKRINRYWNNRLRYEIVQSEQNPHEAHLLSLDCTKASTVLNWRPRWNLDKALQMTVDWNRRYIEKQSVRDICLDQINEYEKGTYEKN